MMIVLSSRIMARTTVDIDGPILNDLKKMQEREGKTLGRLVSDLLADAISRRNEHPRAKRRFTWESQAMEPLVDIADKDAVYAAMEAHDE
jgi:hypothetical protein